MQETRGNGTHHAAYRALIVIGALSVALLACTLTFNTSPAAPNDPGADANSGGNPDAGVAPVVRIIEPASGVTAPANQPLDLIVQTDTTATRFQLTAGGQVASTKSLPDDQSGPTSAILSWTPLREGTYTLEVVAYNDLLPSPPAAIMVTVSGTAGGGPAAQSGAGCTGRVLVSQLNFRDGPGTSYTKLGQFQTGETVTVIGRNADNTWRKVQRSNAQLVWVSNNPQWLQTEGACGALAVVD